MSILEEVMRQFYNHVSFTERADHINIGEELLDELNQEFNTTFKAQQEFINVPIHAQVQPIRIIGLPVHIVKTPGIEVVYVLKERKPLHTITVRRTRIDAYGKNEEFETHEHVEVE